MKYINKLFMLLAVTAFFAACSDDDTCWNSNEDVTVSMAQTEVRVKEGAGLFDVPITVTGETNAPVKVKVSVRGTGDNPATKDVNYMVTDTTIIISGTTGNVEIKTVDDSEVNEDRTFEVYIVSVEGAKFGNNTATTVVLRDNDSEFYEKLQGSWTLNYTTSAGAAKSIPVTITGGDEDSEDYNKTLYMTGLGGYSWTEVQLTYDYDKSTGKGTVTFDNLGEYDMATDVNFGLGFTCSVRLYNRVGSSLKTTPIEGTWSSDFKTVTFDQTAALCGGIHNQSTADFSCFTWFSYFTVTLTR